MLTNRKLHGIAIFLIAAVPITAADHLPGTRPLTIKQPLDVVMVDGINRFCLRELAASRDQRAKHWKYDFTSNDSYEASITANRSRFLHYIGAVDKRLTEKKANHARFELLSTLNRPSELASTDSVSVHAVRWPVLDGITAEGLLLIPKTIRACVVAVPDADWIPEMFCGLTGNLPDQVQFVRRLSHAGCLVAIPTLIDRNDEFSGSDLVAYTNQPHREFIYRQAFEMGRHVIGYEVQKVQAAVDLFQQLKLPLTYPAKANAAVEASQLPIGVVGVGEGGLIALYAAAIDRRIQSTMVSSYFQTREAVWQEPIYRNVWGLLTEFGDAELASLIAPRRLVIEACRSVEVSGRRPARKGRRQVAAPGRIETAKLDSVKSEFLRVQQVYKQLGINSAITLAVSGESGDGPSGGTAAISAFARGLGIDLAPFTNPPPWKLASPVANSRFNDAAVLERQGRQFHEMQVHVQNLLRLSPQVRNRTWDTGTTSVKQWNESRKKLRDWVYDELIGRFPHNRLPANPRTRRILENEHYTGYEVLLDVFPDVIAGGILLLPKDMSDDEQRPLVVCQHGLEGLAVDTISKDPRGYRFYKSFSDRLCRRGFIVYAPQNPYRGKDRFRTIQRKSNPLKRSLFSYIIAQHQQTVDWLATLPNVDPKRIAYYGLSYGGKTAMRVPPFVERYCLSICSADFTDWVRSIATNEERYGYIFTSEYEIPEWNMGHVASYAELAKLMAPRPFMVEQGHLDGGAPTDWVTGEFGKVQKHYDLMGIGDRTELELFNGPHTINGKGTFRFLHRHLSWP